MRLCRFEVRNFKAIEHACVDWDEILVLIGENNSGKSSVLSAMSWFLSGSAIKDASLFRCHRTDAENAIEFVGHFDQLTPTEQEETAVRGRMHGEKWVLKKRYWFESNASDGSDRGEWKEQLYSYAATEAFADWPNPDSSWNAFPAAYEPLMEQLQNRPARPTNAARDELRQLLRAQRPDLVINAAPEWIPNPGGGGNWKSNANSIIPRVIFVRAVHEATDETVAKDGSTYGKLMNLIVERQLAQRPEMTQLKEALDRVLNLFKPDEQDPERQATEIRELQNRINRGLGDLIGGQALIKTDPPAVRSLVMPSTSLVIRDPISNIETQVIHQGHGLQRALIITLLQTLTELQTPPENQLGRSSRGTILLVEEPELYLHPQMERLMKDVLYKLSGQLQMQVACCTHSPVFLDVAEKHKSIVRIVRQEGGSSTSKQVEQDLFPGVGDRFERQKLQTVARFNPSVNELFFAKSVVLFEEFSAIAAIVRTAELRGVFDRHQRLRREVTLIDCDGKNNVTAFQRVLNAFSIPYRVIHDLDTSNPTAFGENARIAAALPVGVTNAVHAVGPEDLESLLGYTAAKGVSKPFAAVKKIEELHAANALPDALIQAMNVTFFGSADGPQPEATREPAPDPEPAPEPIAAVALPV